MFLIDEELAHAARALYEWAGSGSCWALNAQWAELLSPDVQDPTVTKVLKIYEQGGQPLSPRSLGSYQELIQPWQPDERGFVSLFEWHGMDASALMGDEDRRLWGPAGSNYGAYLIK